MLVSVSGQFENLAQAHLHQVADSDKNVQEEFDFQKGIRETEWFKEYVKDYGEEPDLNTPDYDYRKAWREGARPDVRDDKDGRFHWPSTYKGENHPNRYVDGVDTITGKPLIPESDFTGIPFKGEAEQKVKRWDDLTDEERISLFNNGYWLGGSDPARKDKKLLEKLLEENDNVRFWPSPELQDYLNNLPDDVERIEMDDFGRGDPLNTIILRKRKKELPLTS